MTTILSPKEKTTNHPNMFNIFLMILFPMMSIIWTLPFILTKCFGYHLHRISDNQKVTIALKKMDCISTIKTADKPSGFIFGRYFIGYINESISYANHGQSINYEIYLLATKKFYDSVTTHELETNNTVDNSINIYERRGSYYNLNYNSRKLDLTHIRPRSLQENHIKTITALYLKKKFAVALIYGKPGSGKSMISLLLAKQLKASYCDAFNPTDPADTLSLVYNTVCPSYDNPLVLVMEELDILINKVHHQLVQPHKAMPIQIKDKMECNQFFDKINRGFYPFLILIMTSNRTPNYIDELDPSYIRPGRVDLRLSMK